MAERAIIRKGDRTSHGGTVAEGLPALMLLGREIALAFFMGNDTAVEGMPGVGGAHCRNDRGARVAQ